MAWTEATEFIDAWIGDDPPMDIEQIQGWIARAERKIRREVPGIVQRLAAVTDETEPDLPDTVKDVVIDMVTRVYRNPERVRQMQETTGPMSGTITYGGDEPGVLYLSAENLKSLNPPAQRRGAFEIDLMPERADDHPLAHAWVNGPDRYAPKGYS